MKNLVIRLPEYVHGGQRDPSVASLLQDDMLIGVAGAQLVHLKNGNDVSTELGERILYEVQWSIGLQSIKPQDHSCSN